MRLLLIAPLALGLLAAVVYGQGTEKPESKQVPVPVFHDIETKAAQINVKQPGKFHVSGAQRVCFSS